MKQHSFVFQKNSVESGLSVNDSKKLDWFESMAYMLEAAGPWRAGSAQKAPGWHDLSPLISSDCSSLPLSLSLCLSEEVVDWLAILQLSQSAARHPRTQAFPPLLHVTHLCISSSHICASLFHTFLYLTLSSPLCVARREVKHAVLLRNTRTFTRG